MTDTKKPQNKTEEVLFFDKFDNAGYDVFSEKGYARILGEFKELVRPKKGERALDVGCGTGEFTRRLKKFGLKTVGLDISPKCIGFARQNNPSLKFVVGDAEKTGFKDRSFDIVVFSGILHHFTDFSRAVKEAKRLLRSGGRIFGYDPNKKNPVMWLYRDSSSPVHSKKGRTENERLLTKSEINRVLKENGFADINVKAVSGISYKYVEGRFRKRALFLYNIFDNILDRTCTSRKIGSFLITYAKKR